MKMLAVNPVILERHIDFNSGLDSWGIIDSPLVWVEINIDELSRHQFSHNPFAPNPVIVGPMVVDEVGL